MKKSLIPLFYIFLTIAGCTSPAGEAPPRPQRTLSDGWMPGEHLEGSQSGNVWVTRREGRTKQGFAYSIFPDGSGGVDTPSSNWTVACRVDAISDQRKCNLTNADRAIIVVFGTAKTAQSVCIVQHDFPGRVGALRVDKNPAITTDENGCVSGSFAKQLLTGREVTTRSVKWPYDYNVDETGLIGAYGEAEALMQFIRVNISKLSF